MSGTGNTFRMANWIKDYFELSGLKADVIMIDNVNMKTMPKFTSSHLVGILFPAHGLMAPWSMIKFLFKMPMGNGATILSAATRGGAPIGKFILPGAVGLGNYMTALILTIKGYRIKAMYSIDMPFNMINLFWGLQPKNVDMISNKAKEKVESIVSKILKGKSIIFTWNNLWDALWGFPLLFLFPVFPLVYILIGRIFMGKTMFSNNQCVGCGLCAKFCPNDAILMKPARKKKRPYWTYHCEACLRCMGFCNKRAIEAGHSWAILMYFITAIPVITYLIKWINDAYSLIPEFQNYWFSELTNYIYVFPAMMLAYWIFWNLIRIPFLNTIFTYTTLTRYFRRYHEPGTRIKDMKNTVKS